jgi:hypothetical protein
MSVATTTRASPGSTQGPSPAGSAAIAMLTRRLSNGAQSDDAGGSGGELEGEPRVSVAQQWRSLHQLLLGWLMASAATLSLFLALDGGTTALLLAEIAAALGIIAPANVMVQACRGEQAAPLSSAPFAQVPLCLTRGAALPASRLPSVFVF